MKVVLCFIMTTAAFVRSFLPLRHQAKVCSPTILPSSDRVVVLGSTTDSASVQQPEQEASPPPPPDDNDDDEDIIVDTSTMTLLEHLNLNVPSHEYILPFYYDILGLGMDPRKAANLDYAKTGKMTLWANCGASQFHLPHGKVAQTIPGHIGLQYPDEQSLRELERRLQQRAQPDGDGDVYERYEKGRDARSGREYIYIVDKYGNQFYCRVSPSRVNATWRQPVIGTSAADVETWGKDVVQRFGRDDDSANSCYYCAGIEYVEFQCPAGTAEKIALFYESVFDATTSVVRDDQGKVAIVAFGKVTARGMADQSLLFRETTGGVPPYYDGHHVAMYVGRSGADFERAYQNAELAGIVWVNPRFSDRAQNLEGAQKWKQFRFKDIMDMDTGERVLELEHEIRSVEHEAWPGGRAAS